MANEVTRREIRSSLELQDVCLKALKQCPGFERVNQIVIQPRDCPEGAANWTLAAVRPRVDNNSLRAARATIGLLQKLYALSRSETKPSAKRRG